MHARTAESLRTSSTFLSQAAGMIGRNGFACAGANQVVFLIVMVVYLIDTRVTHLTKMAEDWETPGPGDVL